jgi:catechol 2,3-dioxygenase-like lactoylglutathione lyase family enzyme
MQATASITKIANVVIPVNDVDAQLAFYTEKLGCDLISDTPFGGEYRWVEVAFPGTETHIAIAPPGPNGTAGNRETGICLSSDDVVATHAALRDAGVDVDAEISSMGAPVPDMFWLRDPEGNSLLVVQAA